MTSRVLPLRSGAVIGKKGRLNRELLAEILARAPGLAEPGRSAAGRLRKTR